MRDKDVYDRLMDWSWRLRYLDKDRLYLSTVKGVELLQLIRDAAAEIASLRIEIELAKAKEKVKEIERNVV